MEKNAEDLCVFRNIFAVFDHLKSKGWTVPWGISRSFEAMQLYDDRYCFVPMPMNPLYRGQSNYYEPSKASLYRRKWSTIEEIERELQIEDFKQILDEHPEIAEEKEAGFDINYIGLAQHYGIPTHVFDLTNSPLVAAFFATTDYNPTKDEYRPVLEMVKKGVLYFFPTGAMMNGIFDESPIWPIGQEALHRPGEQCGYSIELEENDDLNNICHIKFFFWHDPKASIHIFNQCMGGKLLFPFDSMADKVRALTRYHLYSLKSLETIAKKRNKPLEELKIELEKGGCRFLDIIPYRYTDKEKELLRNEYIQKYPGAHIK